MPEDVGFARLLIESYRRCAGTPMGPELEGAADLPRLLDELPHALLAHDTSPDPVFVYANLAAQRCFEYSRSEFVGLPSRLSAEPGARADRQNSMESVLHQGFVHGYRGVRVGRSGRRFWIEDTTIWNIVDGEGRLHGQAALIRAVRPV